MEFGLARLPFRPLDLVPFEVSNKATVDLAIDIANDYVTYK